MKEIEVKFRVKDFKEIKRIARKLVESNAFLSWKGRERSYYFDSSDGELARKSMVLRLRNWKRKETTMTLKISGDKSRKTKFKIREELQIEISDFKTVKKILEKLGFKERLNYSKNRSHWILGKVKIELDQLDKRWFVEIEGSKKDIEKTASLLGLDWAQSTTESYLDLIKKFH